MSNDKTIGRCGVADNFKSSRAHFLGLTMERQKSCTHGKAQTMERCLSCTIDAAAQEIARLAPDAARLDWLARNPRRASIRIEGKFAECNFWGVSGAGNDMRETVDAVMKAEQTHG